MKTNRAVLVWLIVGLIMIYFQIVIGGITRLTGSGLSITKWEIVTGTFPPMTEKSWEIEFDNYKQTPQYQKINKGMPIGDSIFDNGSFKFIYFWEYLHRLWARTMGFVFLFPFLFFLQRKLLPNSLIKDLLVVVFLAGLAAIFGWIMVASGLVNRPWVNAYKLSIHLLIGVSVFAYLWWATIKYFFRDKVFLTESSVNMKMGKLLIIFLTIQIFFGGIMSGMKAALIFPQWPDIGGEIIPNVVFNLAHWNLESFIFYDSGPFVFALVHFIHRGIAYLIIAFSIIYFIKSKISLDTSLVKRTYLTFCVLLLVQCVLGILTLINSVGVIPVSFGVLHQAVAVLLFASFIIHYFVSSRARKLG